MDTVINYSFLYTAIECSSLTAPIDGIISYAVDTTAPFEFGTTATYKCNTGFGLSGINSDRNCGGLNNLGEWSGAAPTCEREQFLYCFRGHHWANFKP